MSKVENNRPPLLRREDLQEALGLEGFKGKLVSGLVYRLLGMGRTNRIYSSKDRPDGPAFSAQVLDDLGVTYEILPEQLKHIPEEGGFITVSNHHFGAADGMILNAVIGSRRPDYKILTTYFLSLIANLKDWFIPVDNFSKGGARSVGGIRMALDHLQDGGSLGLFPAGEVATWQKKGSRTASGKKRVVEDKPWAGNVIKLISKSGLPVVPVYFDGGNSKLFHVLGRLHPVLRTVRLVREMHGLKGKTIKVRIGAPILPRQIEGLDKDALGRYLRSRCYALESQCRKNVSRKSSEDVQEEVAAPVDPETVRKQVESISDKLIFETGGYRAYLIKASDAPALMSELYRLREVTYRAVGEGTGKPVDTDIYDAHYRHLILWHIEDGAIAGSYRIGYGEEILASHEGFSGFYSGSLVSFGPDARGIFSRGMELGRSFVVGKYQREVLPLKLLLAGLCVAAAKCESVEYCVGLVTISALLPDFYKSLTVHFLERDLPLEDAGRFAKATHPFETDFLRVNPDDLLQLVPRGDIDEFDRLIHTLSDGKERIPVLFRKYFSCGAKVACFNVDPTFCDSLDAMIVLRLAEFPPKSIRSFVRSLPQETQDLVFDHFYGSKNPDA